MNRIHGISGLIIWIRLSSHLELNDDELTYYIKQVKQHIVERPSIESKYLEFYSHVFTKEYEFLSDDATPDNIETVINIIASVSGKIKSLTMFDS